jgi:hypothetical protein
MPMEDLCHHKKLFKTLININKKMEEQQIRQESYATVFSQLSDLINYIGKELGISQWTTVSQNQIDTFARTTDDNQWIHVNPELAKKYSPYKKHKITFLIMGYVERRRLMEDMNVLSENILGILIILLEEYYCLS